ncbi:MAG: hypothetical protein V3V49_07090 [Candidatus Krumholzibacteria bacterium]
MITRLLISCVALVLMFGTTSCGDDNPVVPSNPSPFGDLTRKDHILLNLETAYNKMDYAQLKRMLADDFTFYFSLWDIRVGITQVPNWDKASELRATAHMFNLAPLFAAQRVSSARVEKPTMGGLKAAYEPPVWWVEPITAISLELDYLAGDSEWVALPSPSVLPVEGEQYFQKTLLYRFTVNAGSLTFATSNPLEATIRIRSTQEGGRTVWQIVEWYDDLAIPIPVPTTSGSKR